MKHNKIIGSVLDIDVALVEGEEKDSCVEELGLVRSSKQLDGTTLIRARCGNCDETVLLRVIPDEY